MKISLLSLTWFMFDFFFVQKSVDKIKFVKVSIKSTFTSCFYCKYTNQNYFYFKNTKFVVSDPNINLSEI